MRNTHKDLDLEHYLSLVLQITVVMKDANTYVQNLSVSTSGKGYIIGNIRLLFIISITKYLQAVRAECNHLLNQI